MAQLDELIGKYIEVRDKKDALKAAYSEKAARCELVLKTIEGALMKSLQESGVESIKTIAGTAYTTKKTSCTTADKDAFLSFVRDNAEWGLLDARPLKTAVEQYVEEHSELPPGVNWRAEECLQIRRSD